MTELEKVFFGVVRYSLWGTPVEIPEGFASWGKVMKLANNQALTGLVGDVLLRTPEISQRLPQKFLEKLQDWPLNYMASYTQITNTLMLLVTKLRAQGIDPVLLKGQGLAANYPVPQLRQCGDIDLYVGRDNYRKAYEVLKECVSEIDDISCLDDGGKHFHAVLGTIMIEIHQFADVHSSSTFNRIYQEYADVGLSENLVSVPLGDFLVSTPSDNFNAFYVFNHIWHHFMVEGIGLRQICDWALFLHSRAGSLDLEYLSALLQKMKLMMPWQVFGCLAVDILGMPESEFPFYDSKFRDKAQRVLERIMREGNFGQQTEFVRNPTRGYIYEKLFSLKCYFKRFFGLVSIFPYQSFQQLRYLISDGFVRLFKDMKK